MPSHIVWFERLMIGSIVAGLVGSFLLWQRTGTTAPADVAMAVAVMVANFGLMLLLIWLIARRRMGWLRYLFGGMFVLGAWYAIQDLPAEFGAYPIDGILNVVRLGLQGAALVLVFTGNAPAWFAKPASPSR